MGQHHGDRAEGRVSPSERLVSPHSCDTQPRKSESPNARVRATRCRHGKNPIYSRHLPCIVGSKLGFNSKKFEIIQIHQRWMAETEGFEPSIRLLTV
jgi:hypothetical protein